VSSGLTLTEIPLIYLDVAVAVDSSGFVYTYVPSPPLD
jgi:hypothetical protein